LVRTLWIDYGVTHTGIRLLCRLVSLYKTQFTNPSAFVRSPTPNSTSHADETVLSGLSLRTDEFSQAFQQIYFNSSIQVFNFGLVSGTVFLFSRVLVRLHWLDEVLANGMVICGCCPMAINVVIVLTASANGNEASAVFNTIFSNIVGIFLSPALILGYLGSTSVIHLGQVFYKLSLRVVLPLVVGQVLQKQSPAVARFAKEHKWHFKKTQESCLVFLVYTVFCTTFHTEDDNHHHHQDKEEEGSSSSTTTTAGMANIIWMIFYQFLLLISLMMVAWYSLGVAFPNQPQLRVTGLFGCCFKTIALGIPLINSIYEDDPQLGLYALPLLIWHPMQLVIGTLLAPHLARYVQVELQRLKDDDDDDDDDELTSLVIIRGAGYNTITNHRNTSSSLSTTDQEDSRRPLEE
jgi:solute carrier family 10 (sodium/bile acid cotransporter), member 7